MIAAFLFLLCGNGILEAADSNSALALLEQHCLECHGGKSTRSSFDLFTREGLLKGGESGEAAVIPGKSAESLLFKKVSHTHEPGMPYKREKLSAADISILAKWIDEGALYSRPLEKSKKGPIWSLQPIKKVDPPAVKTKRWTKTPIDNFILATLEGKNMKPSRPADKPTLLRRVTFDLTGLPPTPEEMHAFLADKSSNPFEKVVDRLLASPRYGERWARHWLDVVHYADTHGHDQDRPRPNAWPYRDYVIRSFNEDKPYARFVEEQLAGDVLFPQDPNGIVATGFIVAGPWDLSSLMAIMEDTVDKKIARYLDRDDMVTTTMSTFTSSTVHCARCHNHKFDPFLQSEYYNLQSVFAGVDRADRPYDLDASTNALRQTLLKKKLALETKDKRLLDSMLQPELQSKIAAWEKSLASEAIWTVLDPEKYKALSNATLTKQKDLSLLASGESPKTDSYTIVASTDLKGITAVRLETLTDATHPRNGPGRQPENGNFALSGFKVSAAPKNNSSPSVPLRLQNPTADFNQVDWSIEKSLDGDNNTGWSVFPETGKPHFAIFELKEDVGFEGGTTLTFTLEQLYGREHTLLRPRLSVSTANRPVRTESLPENIKKILALPNGERRTMPNTTNAALLPLPTRNERGEGRGEGHPNKSGLLTPTLSSSEEKREKTLTISTRTDEQKIEVASFYLKQQIEKQLATLPPPQMVYAAANDFAPQGNFTPSKVPRPVHVLKRGDVLKPGDPAVPGALSCVPGIPSQFDLPDPNDEGARRAALAKWVTNPKNVLAWRSIVNRVWHYHFGKGIVETPGDFGEMGSKPTHPELLDWLANWFLENGGSMKKLHRLILTSAVYQQDSKTDLHFSEVDSGNAYLWRMNRSRLDAESVRDGVLQITGQLDLKMGGPPVQQFVLEDPNPPNTPVVDYIRFDVDKPESFRRSIYRYLYRSLPDPFMDTLDCADPSQLTPVRNVSMTALQALAMWNNAFIIRQSEHFATRVSKAGSTRDQIKMAYDLALGRSPTSRELKDLSVYAEKYGMANTCRLILNSNEFSFVN